MNKITDLAILEKLAAYSCQRDQKIRLETAQDWAPYFNFLFYLASYMSPKIIVELGVLHGLSTAHLAAGAPEATVIGVDIDLSNLCPAFPWKNVIFLEGDPLKIFPSFPHGPSIDLLFIDSEHTYDVTMGQYQKFRPFVSSGGVILMDDIRMKEEMSQAWEEIPDPKIEFPLLHAEHLGFGAVLCE